MKSNGYVTGKKWREEEAITQLRKGGEDSQLLHIPSLPLRDDAERKRREPTSEVRLNGIPSKLAERCKVKRDIKDII